MQVRQKEIFKSQAQICKALANEKRLKIIHLLGGRAAFSAADLMQAVGLSKTNLSQHMRVLKEAEIVGIERVGTQVAYTLASPKVREACAMLHEFLVERETRRGAIVKAKKPRKS